MVQVTGGAKSYAQIKKTVEAYMLDLMVLESADPTFNRERGEAAEEAFRERMNAMTPEEFQDLLRPAFKEDEWILIALGCVLGFMTGLGQLIFVFGHSF